MVAAADASESEPVSVSEAREQGPSLVPGGAVPQASDPIDYTVAANGTVRVAAAETLGHYADWLGVSVATLRKLNNLQSGGQVALGRPVKLDFSRIPQEQFEQRRRAYHQTLQAEFFAGHRITGTEVVCHAPRRFAVVGDAALWPCAGLAAAAVQPGHRVQHAAGGLRNRRSQDRDVAGGVMDCLRDVPSRLSIMRPR